MSSVGYKARTNLKEKENIKNELLVFLQELVLRDICALCENALL